MSITLFDMSAAVAQRQSHYLACSLLGLEPRTLSLQSKQGGQKIARICSIFPSNFMSFTLFDTSSAVVQMQSHCLVRRRLGLESSQDMNF